MANRSWRVLVAIMVAGILAASPQVLRAQADSDQPEGLPAQEDIGQPEDVFTPSPPPAVDSDEVEPTLLDLNLTGRSGEPFPRLEGSLSIEVQNDHTMASDDRDREINDLITSDDLFLALRLTPAFSLRSGLVLEDVKDPQPGQNRYFGDTGVFVETLGMFYQLDDDATVFAGKINPTFGVAWDLAPGIYGTDIADDYELTERIGLGGSLTLGGDSVGAPTLTAQTFFLDTSILSQSWGVRRGRTDVDDGGASNTETLQSFSATLDGAVPQTGGLRYQLGGERQQRGGSDEDSEWGVATSLYGGFALAEETELRPIVEWALLKNRDGETNTVNYATIGAGVFIDAWNVALSYTGRFTNPRDGGAYTDRLFQVSAGYEFDSGFSLNIGYAHAEDENAADDLIGILLLYELDFRIR